RRIAGGLAARGGRVSRCPATRRLPTHLLYLDEDALPRRNIVALALRCKPGGLARSAVGYRCLRDWSLGKWWRHLNGRDNPSRHVGQQHSMIVVREAPPGGLEPPAFRLTAGGSTFELQGKKSGRGES